MSEIKINQHYAVGSEFLPNVYFGKIKILMNINTTTSGNGGITAPGENDLDTIMFNLFVNDNMSMPTWSAPGQLVGNLRVKLILDYTIIKRDISAGQHLISGYADVHGIPSIASEVYHEGYTGVLLGTETLRNVAFSNADLSGFVHAPDLNHDHFQQIFSEYSTEGNNPQNNDRAGIWVQDKRVVALDNF